jgi:N-glycosylase/DNA lyase
MLEELKKIYFLKKHEICLRLEEFKKIWHEDDERIFVELAFCLLTPQSKARICWDAVLNLLKKNLLFKGDVYQVSKNLDVRFKNNKARYIVEARKFFKENGKIGIKSKLKGFNNIFELRDWLVQNVKGMGYKEASHFLRNIGLGENLAILDRHILKNLKSFKVIKEIPILSKKRYYEVENKMIKFANKIGISMGHLDLLLWYKETGEVFK